MHCYILKRVNNRDIHRLVSENVHLLFQFVGVVVIGHEGSDFYLGLNGTSIPLNVCTCNLSGRLGRLFRVNRITLIDLSITKFVR